MFSIKSTFASVVALALTTVAGQAADMVVKAPMAQVIPQATGYVEVYGGWARTTVDETFCSGICATDRTNFDGSVLGGAGRATFWFSPYVSTQLDAQAEGTSYEYPQLFLSSISNNGHFSPHDYLVAGHINMRSQQQGLIGIFAGAGDAGGGLSPAERHFIIGGEGQYYFNNFTAYVQGGYDTTVGTIGSGVEDMNAWFLRGTGRYFVTPNLMLEGTGLYSNGNINFQNTGSGILLSGLQSSLGFQTWLWQAKAEWRFDNMPFSVFGKYQGSETKYDQLAFLGTTSNVKTTDNRFLIGLRLYMGEGSLLSNDRKGSTLDIIDPLGIASSPLMLPTFGSTSVIQLPQ